MNCSNYTVYSGSSLKRYMVTYDDALLTTNWLGQICHIVVFHRNVEEDEDTENKRTEDNPVSDMSDEYDFDKYDDEDADPNPVLAIGNLAVYASNSGDPYVTLGKNDDDSEKEDDIIKPEDNLILVGHVEGDASILEVYGKCVHWLQQRISKVQVTLTL